MVVPIKIVQNFYSYTIFFQMGPWMIIFMAIAKVQRDYHGTLIWELLYKLPRIWLSFIALILLFSIYMWNILILFWMRISILRYQVTRVGEAWKSGEREDKLVSLDTTENEKINIFAVRRENPMYLTRKLKKIGQTRGLTIFVGARCPSALPLIWIDTSPNICLHGHRYLNGVSKWCWNVEMVSKGSSQVFTGASLAIQYPNE